MTLFPRRRFKQTVSRHVIVHLREGISLDGVLHGVYADGVELGSATFLKADDYDTPLSGAQIIPWATVLWVQEVSDAALVSVADA